MSDPYDVLGVAPNATTDDIRRAYHAAALRHHPDRDLRPGAAERFHAIAAAYAVLRHPERRRLHDARRAAGGRPGAPLLRHILETFGAQLAGAGGRTSWDGDILLVEASSFRLKIRFAPA